MPLDAAGYPHLVGTILKAAALPPATWLALRSSSRQMRELATEQLLQHVAITTRPAPGGALEVELRLPVAPWSVLPLPPGAPDTPDAARWRLVKRYTRAADICGPRAGSGAGEGTEAADAWVHALLASVLADVATIRRDEPRRVPHVGQTWVTHVDLTDQRYHEHPVLGDEYWPGDDPMDLDYDPAADSDVEAGAGGADSESDLDGENLAWDADDELAPEGAAELKTEYFVPQAPVRMTPRDAVHWGRGSAMIPLPVNVQRAVVHLRFDGASPLLSYAGLWLFPLAHRVREIVLVLHPYGETREDWPEYLGSYSLGCLRVFLLRALNDIAAGADLTVVGAERCHPGYLLAEEPLYEIRERAHISTLRGAALRQALKDEYALTIGCDNRFGEWCRAGRGGVPAPLAEELAARIEDGSLEDDAVAIPCAYNREKLNPGQGDWRHLIPRHYSFVSFEDWAASLPPERRLEADTYDALYAGGFQLEPFDLFSYERLAVLQREEEAFLREEAGA
ncbi:hypothetical protein Q8F55_005138 [Vanrija albida]|uniref:F-box domain-containing protein n=1 Tax=Vanrija albida TaxID=181172 RepID=A0ABR3Q0S5_9TREE